MTLPRSNRILRVIPVSIVDSKPGLPHKAVAANDAATRLNVPVMVAGITYRPAAGSRCAPDARSVRQTRPSASARDR